MLMQGETYQNCENRYNKPTQIFSDILEYHVPSTRKTIRGNQAHFMKKKLRKAIMAKSKAENLHIKLPSRENLAYKEIKSKCRKINKKARSPSKIS